MSSEKEPEFKKCLENVVERLNAKKEHEAIVKECRAALEAYKTLRRWGAEEKR